MTTEVEIEVVSAVIVINEKLVFNATHNDYGYELWALDISADEVEVEDGDGDGVIDSNDAESSGGGAVGLLVLSLFGLIGLARRKHYD